MKKSIQNIKKKIIPVLKRHKVSKAGIFGSFVREEEKKNSDIDILVDLKEGSLLDLVALKLELEKTLKRKTDVLTYDSLCPLLKDKILNEERTIL